ncbi:NAD/NADP octopine/nopaline dehydrogenase family protein [Agrobacterium sp. SHOUNA12C]|nr:NAD/NADP octopine/nopaline dehydrogenase family protein [Agrobacterium sp. BETTINA12B]MCJ9755114.1 NAD/NADP octopine/nopaline dehydrogenase family protein [Agrobacterium sp. SHOUNA12C]
MPVLSKPVWDMITAPIIAIIKDALSGDAQKSDSSDDTPRSAKKVTILGGGPVGFAMAVFLQYHGFKVIIWSDVDHSSSTNALRESGVLEAMGDVVSGSFKPHTTVFLPTALSFSNIVISTIPSHGQDKLMQRLAENDMSKHYLLHIIGNLIAPANRDVWKSGKRPAYQAELSTSPMNVRMPDGKVFIKGLKHRLVIATWPIDAPDDVKQIFESILPQKPTWLPNVLDVFALGVPAIAHVFTFMHSLAWAEATNGDYYFYGDAMATPSMGKLLVAGRKEWNDIFREYNCPVEDIEKTFNKNFNTNFVDISDFAKNTVPHNLTLGAPKSADHRYMTQDIPFGIVPAVHLASPVGKSAPLFGSYVVQGNTIHDADFMATGRNLTRGMTGNIKEAVLALVNMKADE